MRGCIICNGDIRDYERAKVQIAECELVIAADGGIRHLGKMRVVPNVVVGDMDSVDTLSWQEGEKVEQLAFPESKDKICLVVKNPGRIAIMEVNLTLVAVDGSERCMINGEEGSIVSLVPFPEAENVTTIGLKYPLEKENLLPGTRGISNVLYRQNGHVCISGGLLLVYVENKR